MGKDKELLESLARAKGEKGKYMFYLPVKLHSEFKKVCGTAPLSRVMEKLIEDFIARNKK